MPDLKMKAQRVNQNALTGEFNVTRVEPAEPLEHQAIRVFFTVKNTSFTRTMAGTLVMLNRNTGQSGRGTNVGEIAPGASVERFVDGEAPAASKDAEMEFGFFERPPADGTEPLSPTLKWSANLAVAAEYELRVDAVTIENPRAPRNDTLRGEATALYNGEPIANPAPASPFDQPGTQVHDFGNRGAGSVLDTPFRFGPFRGVPGVAADVKFNYIFDNRGFQGSAEEVGGRVLNDLSKAGQALATFAIPQGAAAFDKANEVHEKINNALFSDCDGIVAADQIVMKSDVLEAVTRGTGSFSENRPYIGSSSPAVCGMTSHYRVRFTITRTSFR
jgi:hypothetical protein